MTPDVPPSPLRIPSSRALVTALAGGLLGAAAAACGGAEEAPRSPAPAAASPPKSKPEATTEGQTPEPRTVEQAQEQIARARAELEGLANGPDKSGEEREKSLDRRPPADAPAPAPPSPVQPGQPRRSEAAHDTCGGPCRALGSMRRAVDALCRMTGDSDKRCIEAKKTLTESATRLSTCQCEAP